MRAIDGTRTRGLRLDRAALYSSELRRHVGGSRIPPELPGCWYAPSSLIENHLVE